MIELLRVAGPENAGFMAFWVGLVLVAICGMISNLIGKWIDRDRPIVSCTCGCHDEYEGDE